MGFTALAYDAVLLVDAVAGHLINEREKVTGPAILRKLPGFSFEGVLGSIQISRNNSVERREKILQVKDGAFVEVAK